MRKIIAKIYVNRIRKNAQTFRALTGAKLCAVVKADGYGHGAEEVANALSGVADYFAVALLSEAVAIRVAVCGKPILILTPPVSERDVVSAGENGFILTVSDFQSAKLVAKVAKEKKIPLRVHLKTNTGMNRYGVNGRWLGRICNYLRTCKTVRIEGLYSHLYTADREKAEMARSLFLRHEKICKRYFPRVICHLSATYGATLGKEFAFDMVRIGIGLYGYLPNGATLETGVQLRRCMETYAVTVATRKYAFGGAGYGESALPLQKGDCLSVLRYGYADGFLRKRQNGVLEEETQANPLCMDACVRKRKGKKGEQVCLFQDASAVAKQTGTIVYEVLCSATRRAERIYIYD